MKIDTDIRELADRIERLVSAPYTLHERIENILKCRNSYSEDEQLKKHDEIRSQAEADLQKTVDEFIAHAKANALAKKKNSRAEMVAMFLLMMLDSEEEAYATHYEGLEKLEPVEQEKKPSRKEVRADAERFSKSRKKFLSNFPETTFDAFEEVIKVAKEEKRTEKEVRGLLNRKAEEIKVGHAKLVAETEAQIFYGDAEMKVLQRAGYDEKFWQSMEDEKVRASHDLCQSQGWIALGAKFHNGMLYPGDPRGDISEIANCRCFILGRKKK